MTIPSDIITQILHLLPSKSIARFRCVSKDWLSLLTDPKFIKTHKETLKRNHLIFCDKHRDDQFLYSHPFSHDDSFIFKPTKLPIEPIDGYITFQGSCDGLVLVSSKNRGSFETLVLFNPITREFVQLPQSSCYYFLPGDQEGVNSCNAHGIGYDSVTDDYKVITLTYFEYYIADHTYGYQVTDTTTRVSIYSRRSNTWRQLFIDNPYEFRYMSHAIYVDGFFHWICMKKDTDCSKVIVAFSLVDECFREVPSPNYCNDTKIMSYRNNPKLIVLGGKLAIYVSSQDGWWHETFEVWLMDEYGVRESWTKVPLDIFDDEFHMVNSRTFDDNGKIRVANKGQMFIYDFEKRTFSKNVYMWSFHKFRLMGSYVESLVSLKRKDTIDVEQILNSRTKRENVYSKASDEAALWENLDPICHPFCNKSLRYAKILNDRKASLRKKEREERKEKPKNKRKNVKKSKKYIFILEDL